MILRVAAGTAEHLSSWTSESETNSHSSESVGAQRFRRISDTLGFPLCSRSAIYKYLPPVKVLFSPFIFSSRFERIANYCTIRFFEGPSASTFTSTASRSNCQCVQQSQTTSILELHFKRQNSTPSLSHYLPPRISPYHRFYIFFGSELSARYEIRYSTVR